MYFTLPKNVNGRDFIAGDLHGCYKDLMALLEHVNFNIEADRLFLVGDLVDRGPHSMECLRLLKAPYVYAVKGNHEDMMVDAISTNHNTRAGHEARQVYLWNGGKWAFGEFALQGQYAASIDPQELKALAKVAEDLPHVITVEDSFSVMHAEPPMFKDRKEDLEDYTKRGWFMHPCFDGSVVLWGRNWFYNFYDEEPSDVKYQPIPRSSLIETMYVGHTPLKRPMRLGFLVNLDTGAGKKGHLTLHCHTTSETFSYIDGKVVPNEIYVYRNE